MANIVDSILQAAVEKEAKFKPTEVEKEVDLEIDEGNLLGIDTNHIDLKVLKENREEFLKSLARENTQLLINKIWQLPVERVEDAVIAKLPAPTTRLPREKPVPEKKKLTKWEQYSKEKGFVKRKKDRMMWDEEKKEWRPRWGYKRAGGLAEKWVLEVPENADPYEDQFGKLKKASNERVAKNELQRLRNLARNMKGKTPGVGITPAPVPSKEHVTQSLHVARTADASLGRFSKDLKNEKPMKDQGKKRKFESNYANVDSEKKRALDILGRIQGKKPVLDTRQATHQEINKQNQLRAMEKGGKGKGKFGGKDKKGNFGKKKGTGGGNLTGRTTGKKGVKNKKNTSGKGK